MYAVRLRYYTSDTVHVVAHCKRCEPTGVALEELHAVPRQMFFDRVSNLKYMCVERSPEQRTS
jgi:hypothetical protein